MKIGERGEFALDRGIRKASAFEESRIEGKLIIIEIFNFQFSIYNQFSMTRFSGFAKLMIVDLMLACRQAGKLIIER